MKKFFYFLMALPLVFVACDNEPEPTPKPEQPSLKLTSDAVVEFSAEGGQGTITYICNAGNVDVKDETASEITTLKIECEAEWIEIAREVAPLGEVKYDVAKNDTTEARDAKIKLTLDALSIEVTVKQAAGADVPEPEPSYEGWGIVGTMNDWDVAKAIVMERVGGYYAAKAVELATTDRFKFVKDGDNAVNRGGNGQSADVDYLYKAQAWGSDIHVSVAGTYDIYINAKEDTYYIMSEGKSPAEALEPLAPGEDLYEVYGNFAGEKARLSVDRKYMVAKGVKFDTSAAEFDIRVNETEVVYGAKEDATYAVEEQIEVAEGSAKIKVEVEADTEYDIYYRADMSSVWVMPMGSKPMVWEETTGIAFSSTNFAICLVCDGLEIFFDFNCGVVAQNDIIPEATYYVNDVNDSGFNFNLENEYDIRIEGFKTKLKDGTMVIKHISGGYDIIIDVESIHNHEVKVHYAGPLGEIPLMGRPVTNPE